MKEERNNEIDLLLRRLSGRNGESPRDDRNQTHLDADELSAYAENALPPAARARYTTHLAECTSCRRLVTELSLSLGATAARVETIAEPSGWKAFLASLFSPMVLRYAVPALGLIVVTAIGFVVLRQQGGHSLTARREETAPAAQITVPSPAPALGGFEKNNVASDAPEQKSDNPAKPGTAGAAAPKAAEPQTQKEAIDDTTVAALPPATPADRQALAKLEPGVATSSAPAAAPQPASTQPAGETKTADAAKPGAAAQTVTVQNEAPKEGGTSNFYRVAPSPETREQDKQKALPLETRGAVAARNSRRKAEEAARARTDDATKDDAAKDETETRSVAGRQFRRERGIWVDTAYDSSTATVNMARSSEQFRALVADEPAIGAIAKQLDGEVIVVWKGRAYRIR